MEKNIMLYIMATKKMKTIELKHIARILAQYSNNNLTELI